MELASQLKDISEVTKLIPQVVKDVGELFNSPLGFWVVVAAVLLVFIKLDYARILDVLERKDKKRREHMDAYVSKADPADDATMRVIREMRDTYYFKVSTGIYAEAYRRDALIRLQKLAQVAWTEIRRALEYIEQDQSGQAFIREATTGEKINAKFYAITGFIFMVGAALCFATFVWLARTSVIVWAFPLLTVALLVLAMFTFSQNFPLGAARRIKKALDDKKSSRELQLVQHEPAEQTRRAMAS